MGVWFFVASDAAASAAAVVPGGLLGRCTEYVIAWQTDACSK